MTARTVKIIAALYALCIATPSAGHHSFAAVFDADSTVEVSGVVTKLDWRNPHAWIFIEVTDNEDDVQEWSFEHGATGKYVKQMPDAQSHLGITAAKS